MMKRFVSAIGAIILVGSVGLISQANQKLVDTGKQLYDKYKCTDCHTINNRGGRLTKQFPMDDVGKTPPAEMRMWLTNPLEMEAKSTDEKAKKSKLKLSSKKYKFTEAELDALIAYLQTLKKK